ncbi:reverse transcriptase, partial [Phytophthora megakarya]
EDLEGNVAVHPKIPISTTAKVSIEDLQVGDSRSATPEEIEKLRQIIWKKRHPLIGKGNTLPPAAKGVVCDIDVGNAKPIALRTRKVPTRSREKVAVLIKDLLEAEIIRPSTSPWASPIVIVRESNRVDIRLCIDYKLVNSLTRLMVYPMPLISDLVENIDKELCRMLFGLKSAPQFYQRLVDNALYGFLKISRTSDNRATTDVYQTGIADDPDRGAVVENLLEACDKWNLSIGVALSFWGMDKVGYLGHRVAFGGLEANPQAPKSLTDLPFPGLLRSMDSFLVSLNYYGRFIEGYAIYIMDQNDPIARDHDTPEPQLVGPLDERRTLKTNELNYNVTETEVLALLRILDLYYNVLVGGKIRTLTRHFTLAWLFKSTGLQGCLGQWSALLASWTLEITEFTKGEDEILGAIAASITPRAKVDDALTEIAPRKEPKRRIQAPIPTVDREEVRFDGSARVKRGGGAFSAIVWSLPAWEVVKARSDYPESLTVNEA